MTRYKWVASRKAEGFPTNKACQVAGVSTSAFNDWRRRVAAGPTDAELAEDSLVAVMAEIHAEFDGTYGSPRMVIELANRGHVVNIKRVERLMRKHAIVGVHKPAKVRTTIPSEDTPPLPDLIGGDFKPGEIDVAWIGDITYVRTDVGWLYLATLIDSDRDGCWATQWLTICAPNSSSTRSPWPPRPAGSTRKESFSMGIVEPNTCQVNTVKPSRRSA